MSIANLWHSEFKHPVQMSLRLKANLGSKDCKFRGLSPSLTYGELEDMIRSEFHELQHRPFRLRVRDRGPQSLLPKECVVWGVGFLKTSITMILSHVLAFANLLVFPCLAVCVSRASTLEDLGIRSSTQFDIELGEGEEEPAIGGGERAAPAPAPSEGIAQPPQDDSHGRGGGGGGGDVSEPWACEAWCATLFLFPHSSHLRPALPCVIAVR